MNFQNDVFFEDAHILQFLPHIEAGGVSLELDLAIFDVEVEDGVIEAVQAFSANAHELIGVTNGIKEEFIFDYFPFQL